MMKKRQIPYGYTMRDGQYVVKEDEAVAVRDVYRHYRNGQSYRQISIEMNINGYPPNGADGWTKHHVKRVLENKRYLGDSVYPMIISENEYNAVRAVHNEKVTARVDIDKSAEILWKRLICTECKQRLIRTNSRGGVVLLRCECGVRLRMRLSDVHSAVCALMIQAADTGNTYRAPSTEAAKLNSRISRALMKPDDPAEAVKLILQGIDARYAGIPVPPLKPNNDEENRLFEPDWKAFKEAVSHISLSPTKVGLKTISGRDFSTGRNDDYAESDTAPAGSDGDSR